MRLLLSVLLLIPAITALANMASPVQPGDLPASPFLGRHAAVVHESIEIETDGDFSRANFRVTYTLTCDSAASGVPLLFYAAGLRDSFRVWLDGREIALLPLPGHLSQPENGLPGHFDYLYRTESGFTALEYTALENSEDEVLIHAEDLRYFEAGLDTGRHEFRVEYTAAPWTDRSDWVRENSFRYALFPARHWKSFGGLDISLTTTAPAAGLSTNLGPAAEGRLPGTLSWHFDGLPADMIILSFKPEMDRAASLLLRIGPDRLTYGLAGLLLVLHVFALWLFRRANPTKRISWVWLTGSLAVPLVVLASYPALIGLIDGAIGPSASRYHGYPILAIGLYPIAMPVYAVVMFLADLYLKRAARAENPQA